MIALETIQPRWDGLCIVAAPGCALTRDVAQACRGWPTVAVGDAYLLLPWADVLYHCDAAWWDVHLGCPAFAGEKWSSHEPKHNEKLARAEKYGLRLVKGRHGEGFSSDPETIHYGGNSGFQAINLAILWGATRIVLVGFDMHGVGTHFFGHHPPGLKNATNYRSFIPAFEKAAKMLPPDIEILNATPGTALTCFPGARLEDVL